MKPIVERTLIVFVGLCALWGCSSARRGATVTAAVEPSSPRERLGETVYMERCHKCHPGGEAGLGPSLNDKPLPRFLIRWQVRQGFGVMPSFSEEQIGADELDALIEYMKTVRAS